MIKYDGLLRLLEENGYNSYKLKTSGLIGQATYYAIKNGTGGLDYRSINKLCEHFKCQPNDLMRWVPDEEQ